jgi:hypothetical protein
MSAFGSGSLANYSANSLMEGYAKKVISHNGANGNLVISSRDRLSGTYANPLTQPWNNFVVQKGFPIQQGQIMNVKVSEILFPWVIENINSYNNLCVVLINGVEGVVSIPPGFYTGATLAVAVNAATAILFPGHSPTLVYESDGSYTWTADSGDNIALYPLFQVGADPLTSYLNEPVTRDCLLSVLGFNFATQDYTTPTTYPNGKRSGFAPLVYTQYVDICSDVLTQYQELVDASTSTPNKNHVICRLYIANETSTVNTDASGNPIFPGMNPFVLHRQFKNPKVMKWNSQNSIDRVDLQLYDDQGRRLFLPENNTTYPDFQITFQSAE